MNDIRREIRAIAQQMTDRGVTITWQVVKMMEEVGEVANAWTGSNGMNKRKGYTHTDNDVIKELADVAITALVGIEMLGYDSVAALAEKLAGVRENYKDVK